MSAIEQAMQRVREVAARRGGMKALAREAGVPYTTVHTLAQRGWANQSLDALQRLMDAAERLQMQDESA